jgi:anthranilate synthase component II
MLLSMSRLLLLDNYDSFTYNLYQLFLLLNIDVVVLRNDQLTPAEAFRLNPSHLVLSPGPGRPENAGNMMELIACFEQQIPILGICLGHQALALHFGATIVEAQSILHGKSSLISHNQADLFKGLSTPLKVGRYHSLAVENVPEDLQIIASSSDGEVMGLQHCTLPIYGLQFHPESILSPEGPKLLRNFLE